MEKVSFNEHTTSQISKLKEQIVQLNADIERKRDFFLKLQDPTDDFLESLSTSYISDFVTGKVGINRAVKYNETNINDIIGIYIR